MRPRRIAVGAVLAYAALIHWASSQPNPTAFLPEVWLVQDKLLHGLEFAVLGALAATALRLLGVNGGRTLALAILAASAYAALDELHQSFVPGRSADLLDWVADTIGASLGAVAALPALRRWGPRASIPR